MQDDKRARGMELVTLSLLAASAEPVGSPRLVTAFRAEGIDLAEATAGRYLRLMDERGLTTRIGRQGRIITERGRRRLRRVQLLDRLDVQSSELVRILSDSDAETLTEILRLRRPVEGEAARLAALRATEDERRLLHAIATQHRDHVYPVDQRKTDSLDFHLAVARASHSPIVQAVIELLIEPVNDPFMKLLDLIAIDAGAQLTCAMEHIAVATAILEHDAAGAEQAMGAHLLTLAALAERFLAGSPDQKCASIDQAALT